MLSPRSGSPLPRQRNRKRTEASNVDETPPHTRKVAPPAATLSPNQQRRRLCALLRTRQHRLQSIVGGQYSRCAVVNSCRRAPPVGRTAPLPALFIHPTLALHRQPRRARAQPCQWNWRLKSGRSTKQGRATELLEWEIPDNIDRAVLSVKAPSHLETHPHGAFGTDPHRGHAPAATETHLSNYWVNVTNSSRSLNFIVRLSTRTSRFRR